MERVPPAKEKELMREILNISATYYHFNTFFSPKPVCDPFTRTTNLYNLQPNAHHL